MLCFSCRFASNVDPSVSVILNGLGSISDIPIVNPCFFSSPTDIKLHDRPGVCRTSFKTSVPSPACNTTVPIPTWYDGLPFASVKMSSEVISFLSTFLYDAYDDLEGVKW